MFYFAFNFDDGWGFSTFNFDELKFRIWTNCAFSSWLWQNQTL